MVTYLGHFLEVRAKDLLVDQSIVSESENQVNTCIFGLSNEVGGGTMYTNMEKI